MSSSSSTIPASRITRSRTVLTWALLSVWSVLISFGLIAMSNPRWLEDLARQGEQAESSAYRHLGINEMHKGNWSRAIAQFQYALKIRNDDPIVFLDLGIAHLRQGDVEKAKAAFREAQRLEPSSRIRSRLTLQLGEIARRENHPEEAERLWRQALAEGERRDLAEIALGDLYLEQKDYDRAYEAFSAVLAAQLDPIRLWNQLVDRVAEAAKEDPVAQRWFADFGNRPPTDDEWSRYDRASIEAMTQRDPEIAKTLNHLGLISYERGDRAAAIGHFQRSLAVWPGNQDATNNLRLLAAAGN